ncbi:hypothetical protein [Actinoplanes sp. DH11]|uniref:hypothetical protein n=1 Tax=Actinoplanes sp. DH11 TaxID=2857011 RepID=UPI001E5D13AD|nr:hypothetical protein [Actinoplanes sp. DH11]
MSSTRRTPTREEVEAWFTGLIDGTRTRDQADRWAARWFIDPHAAPVEDGVVEWALDLLHGIDLLAGPDGRFLHTTPSCAHG